jgi:hypothetical protein
MPRTQPTAFDAAYFASAAAPVPQAALTDTVTLLIPGMGTKPPVGIFGLGSLSKAYFALSLLLGIRRWRLIIHMHLEQHSEFEGEPLFFFQLFPESETFWLVRIVWEPVFVFASATILGRALIFQTGLTTYLQIAALALGMKEFITFYRAWEYLRGIMDAKFVGSIIARMFDNKASDHELARIHLASFPQNLQADIRREAVAHIARDLGQEPTPSSTIPNEEGPYEHHS